MKNLFFFLFIAVILLLGGTYLLKSRSSSSSGTQLASPTNYEYYWSNTCPHCANVSKFMDTWEGRDKIKMEKYEINESSENSKKFLDRGTFCEITKSELGVPLLVTPESGCLLGDEPIIEFLQKLD